MKPRPETLRRRTRSATPVAAFVVGASLILPVARGAAGAGERELVVALERAGASEESLDRRLQSVVGLGTDVVPHAVRLAAGRSSGPPLAPRERELLTLALERWPEEPCIQAALLLLGAEPTLEDATAVARLLGSFAGGRGVQPLCAIVRALDPSELRHPRVANDFEDALAAMLARDRLAHGFVREEIPRADARLLSIVVGALGKAPSDDSIALLERLLGRDAELDARILEAYGMQGALLPRCAEGACAEAVRRYLNDRDPKLRRHAVVALGRLGDTTVAGALVAGLDDRDRRVRGASLWALRRVTGLGWSADAARWELHLESEERWLATTFPGLADAFLDANASRAREAVHEVAKHVWVRHATAPRLALAFEHEAPAVAIAACEALGRLGGPEAARALEQARLGSRSEVREAAERALLALRAREAEGPSF